MTITPEEIRHVAKLARLEMPEASVARFTAQIDNILGYVNTLEQVTTDEVPPTAHAIGLSNALREDVATPPGHPADSLANAPALSQGMFEVPKIIE